MAGQRPRLGRQSLTPSQFVSDGARPRRSGACHLSCLLVSIVYLLDRPHCESLLIRREPAVLQALQALPEGSNVGTNSLILGALAQQAARSSQPASNRDLLAAFSQRLHVYPIDRETVTIYGQLTAELAARCPDQLASAPTNTLWLASTALQHQATLLSASPELHWVTQIQPLAVESWLPNVATAGDRAAP